MDLHLLDNKLENEMLPSVSCNNYYSTLITCIVKYNSVFMLHMLFSCFTGRKPECILPQVHKLQSFPTTCTA